MTAWVYTCGKKVLNKLSKNQSPVAETSYQIRKWFKTHPEYEIESKKSHFQTFHPTA